MGEPGDDTDLAQEPLRPDGGGEILVDHLEGDGPVVTKVVSEVDDCRAAPAEEGQASVGPPLDFVPVREGRREALVYGYHAFTGP